MRFRNPKRAFLILAGIFVLTATAALAYWTGFGLLAFLLAVSPDDHAPPIAHG